MTQATLEEAFQQTRDNLIVMANEAVPENIGTYPYVVPAPNLYPRTEFFVSAGRREKTSSTTQSWTVPMTMKITVATVSQGHDGQAQQLAQFTILPVVLEYFEKHGGINTTGHPRPRWLDAVNTGIRSFEWKFEDNKIVIVLNWDIVFNTAFGRC